MKNSFVKIPASVMAHWADLKPSTKAVLVALASFIGSTGSCWPGRDQVMQRAGISDPHGYAEAMRELREKNIMHISRRFRNSSVYRWSEGAENLHMQNSYTCRIPTHVGKPAVKVQKTCTQTRLRELEEEERAFSADTKYPEEPTCPEKASSFFSFKNKNPECPFGHSRSNPSQEI